MANILLADDNLQIREFLTEMLQLDGHTVTSCKDGEEAIQQLTENHFDLVITDIILPKYDGLEIIEKALGKSKIIAMSGDDLLFEKATAAGANTVMLKDADIPGMMAKIAKTLAED